MAINVLLVLLSSQRPPPPFLVNMALNVHRNHKAYWRGEEGGGWGGGGRGNGGGGGEEGDYVRITIHLSPPEWLLH